MHGYDTHIPSNGVGGAQVSGKYPAFSTTEHREGVVIAVHYIDDPRNRNRKYTEYDVRDLRSGQIYPACRRLHQTAGMDSGTDDILTPASAPLKSARGPLVFDPTVSPLAESNGDRVALAFIHGAHTSPIILGVLSHRATSYAARRVDGHRKFTTHRGTSVETKEDGTHVITRTLDAAAGTKTTITVQPNGDVVVLHDSGAKISVLSDGSVEVEGSGSAKIHADPNVAKLDGQATSGVLLGFSATEPVVKGTTANTATMAPIAAAAAALAAAAAATAAAVAGDFIGGAPTLATTSALVALAAAIGAYGGAEASAAGAFATSLSVKVKTE